MTIGCVFGGGAGTGVSERVAGGGVGDAWCCSGVEEEAEATFGDAGTEDCEPADCSALALLSLVRLCKIEEEFTCSGRERAEFEIPVCCTSGGVGFEKLVVGIGLGNGMNMTGGDVFVGGEIFS